MPTAIQHIKGALGIIGQESNIMPAPPEMYQRGLSVLNSMIARWINNGIEIEIIPADIPGNEVYNDEWATPAIQYNLAVMMCPECNITVTPDVLALARSLYAEVVERTRLYKTLPQRSIPDGRLPIGSGNDRGVLNAPRFYGPYRW